MATDLHGATGGRLRALARLGARRGPHWWLRASPTLIGLGCFATMPASRKRLTERQRQLLGSRGRFWEQLDVSRTFVSYAHSLAEALAAGRPEADRAVARLRDPSMRDVLNADGGLVLVTAHVGAWDAAGPLLARDSGRPVTVVMHAEADARAGRVQDAVRAGAGVHVLHVGDDPLAALPLLSRLRRKEVVAVQIDRAPPQLRCIQTQLAGRPFAMPEGPFRLASMASVPLLPLFARRVGSFDYELWAGPVVHLPRRADGATLRHAADQVATALERFLRAHPTQWYCFADQ